MESSTTCNMQATVQCTYRFHQSSAQPQTMLIYDDKNGRQTNKNVVVMTEP